MIKNIKSIFGKIKKFILNTICFIAYQMAERRKFYRYSFIGEKVNEKEPFNTIILYRIKGVKGMFELPIKVLISDIKLVENFPTSDILKFGFIAMGDRIFQEKNDSMQNQFLEIKRKMLASADSPNNSSSGNYYPCKFAGEKITDSKSDTTILYTIMGKREIFEISIKALLENTTLLEKFHPTFIIKLGAIGMGNMLFSESQSPNQNEIENIKNNIVCFKN